jgi:hypothetical protein
MNESQARLVDALCKVVATIALVTGGGWTLYTYFNARALEARTTAIEARKPFLAKRFEVYGQIVDLVSKIAYDTQQWRHMYMTVNNIDPSAPKAKEYAPKIQPLRDQIDANVLRLDELRYGLTLLVEDEQVEKSINEFGICTHAGCDDILAASKNVAKACKDSIGSEWK